MEKGKWYMAGSRPVRPGAPLSHICNFPFSICHVPRHRRGGFTLVQLLVVIGILVLLIAFAFPALLKAMRQGTRTRTEADLQLIGTALDAYKQDFGDYPRFDDSTAADQLNFLNDRGARLLCRALIAPGPKLPPAGYTTGFPPVAPQGAAPDGADGPGFSVRAGTGGKTYGPYIQPDKFQLGGIDTVNRTDATILDREGNPILYYPATPGTREITALNGFIANPAVGYAPNMARPLYNANDNFSSPGPPVKPLMSMFELRYILGDRNNNGQLDPVAMPAESAATTAAYLLWSAGPDGIYGRDPAKGKTDDVTNFDMPSDLRK